jgi:hypothetical protein
VSSRPATAALPDWRDYIAMSQDELARHDIAAVNLACAAGLPGAERIDVPWCLGWLDRATELVRRWTAAGLDEFFRPSPAEYKHSEAYFRVLGMTSVLQRHCGVKYDPSKIGAGPDVPFELHEQFVHGVMQGAGGTCATLPVVYASIGRRLGYPIKLVCARQHLFARWDDPATGERFNIECAGVGFNDHPDDHYRAWPKPISGPDEERAFGYLESFTPRRELADFVAQRAFVFCDHKWYREAAETFAVAAGLTPQYATYPRCILNLLTEWKTHLQSQYLPQFPRRINIDRPFGARRWPGMPLGVEREIMGLHATEACLTDPRHEEWWWGPLRENRPPLREVPTSITVNYESLVRNP